MIQSCSLIIRRAEVESGYEHETVEGSGEGAPTGLSVLRSHTAKNGCVAETQKINLAIIDAGMMRRDCLE